MHSLLLFYRVIIEDLCVESGVNCRAMLVISSWEELGTVGVAIENQDSSSWGYYYFYKVDGVGIEFFFVCASNGY